LLKYILTLQFGNFGL